MIFSSPKVVVVTGASAGIGAATARTLAAEGHRVYVGARRLDRLEILTKEYSAVSCHLDVSDTNSVNNFVAQLPEQVDVLINNAGGALGLEQLSEMDEENWTTMYQVNVLGIARITKSLLPRLLNRTSSVANVINMGSVAGFETYIGGGGYTASKHAVRAITETMRLEWLGKPIRVTEIDPGFVKTEFSSVRFSGDMERVDAVYEGMVPLAAEDIAATVSWIISLPDHVNIDQLIIRPRDQARIDKIYRREG